MRRPLSIVAVLGSVLLLAVARGAYAQDQWPPPEVTVQPHQDRGPMPVPPPASEATTPPAPGGWGLVDYTGAAVAIIGALGTAFGGGMGAYHLTCARNALSLTRGPMDWEALVSRLDRIEAGQAAILEAIQAAPTTTPPSPSQPSPPAPPPLPAPLKAGTTVLPL